MKQKPLSIDELALFFQSEIKPEFRKINDRLDKLEYGQKRLEEGQKKLDEGQKKLEYKTQEMKIELSYVKDELRGVKVELSDTPSRKQFEEFKHKIIQQLS